ncbi:hypothetical protein DSO57_1016664 [Entomophthora muscae]|uniref:Uncharacterized protein n=1 Tax=Entomophthora muscae TaxID=34485 RepID=A0ACC2TFU3_9FUNG|nr:hypothetical protein DSO57_1016664 [Entomophthora muscae]
MGHLTTPKAMSMIKPFANDSLAFIPCCATILKKDGTLSSEFKVFPERIPSICVLCSALGHREALCLITIEGVRATEQDTPKECQNSEPTGNQYNALIALIWKNMAEYAVLKSIPSHQKKAHAKAQNLSQPQPIKETESAQEEHFNPGKRLPKCQEYSLQHLGSGQYFFYNWT